MFISLLTRFITSIGQGAPAMMPVRSDVRSKFENSPWSSSAMNIVGTPYSAVHFSCSDRSQRRERIKPLAGIDHRRAERDGGEVAHDHPEAMIERHRNADAVLFGEAHGAADEIAVVENVVMGQRHALGRSRRSAGELDVDGIVELQGGTERGELLAVQGSAHDGGLLERNRARTGGAADLDHDAQGR